MWQSVLAVFGSANQGQAFTSFPQTVHFEITLLLKVIQISCVLAFVSEIKLISVLRVSWSFNWIKATNKQVQSNIKQSES